GQRQLRLARDVEQQVFLGGGIAAAGGDRNRVLASLDTFGRRHAHLEVLRLAGLQRQRSEFLAAVLLLERDLEAGRCLREKVDRRVLLAFVLRGHLEIEGRVRRAAQSWQFGLQRQLRRFDGIQRQDRKSVV